MSNEIQVFKNEEFGKVRIVVIDGEPWFVGRDVCKILGYVNSKHALKVHVSSKYKMGYRIATPSRGEQTVTLINEAGLYKLIFSSKLPDAEKFTDWVVNEVLPSIRKHGLYIDPTAPINPDLLIAIGQQMKALKRENEIMQPKAKYYDEVLDSSSLIPITRIAKEYGLSGKALNNLLNIYGIQYKQGEVWVLYQEYADEGYAFYSDYPYIDENGDKHVTQLLKWTQKGREFLHNVLTSHGHKRKIKNEKVIDYGEVHSAQTKRRAV